jgi:hypothetical protein
MIAAFPAIAHENPGFLKVPSNGNRAKRWLRISSVADRWKTAMPKIDVAAVPDRTQNPVVPRQSLDQRPPFQPALAND